MGHRCVVLFLSDQPLLSTNLGVTQESRVSVHPSSTASTIPSTGNAHQNASPPSIPSSVRSPNNATLKSIPTSQPDEDEELMDVLPSEQMVKGANVVSYP